MQEPKLTPTLKDICIDCHFLIGYNTDFFKQPKGSKEDSLTGMDRVLLGGGYEKEKDSPMIADKSETHYLKGIRCKRGVWFEETTYGNAATIGERQNIYKGIFELERQGKCYFFPVHEGMTLDAAIDIRDRQEQNEQRQEDRIFAKSQEKLAKANTALAVVVAIATLVMAVPIVVSAVNDILKFFVATVVPFLNTL